VGGAIGAALTAAVGAVVGLSVWPDRAVAAFYPVTYRRGIYEFSIKLLMCFAVSDTPGTNGIY